MKISEVVQAWRRILQGGYPSLSIEVTKECPLRCPGCYAYDAGHLGGGVTLRELSDFKGEELVRGVLEVVDRIQPLHLSLVGGDPLVRHRELELLIPQLIERGVHTQVVTSAFRVLPRSWIGVPKLNVVVSIDGLQPEHDERRKPATYERILQSIAGHKVTVHCTVTGQMMKRPGYLEEFCAFWTPRDVVKKVWFSTFTPQIGDDLPEMLTPDERAQFVTEMLVLRRQHPKIDMPEGMLKQFLKPPHSPEKCIFALTTKTISADLRSDVSPCQLGGNPDCSNCGCIASMGLAAVGEHRLGGLLPVSKIFYASLRKRPAIPARSVPELRVLQ